MKAIEIATGTVVDVVRNGYVYMGNDGTTYTDSELDFNQESVFMKEMNRPRPLLSVDDIWVQRRYEIARSVISGFAANRNCSGLSDEYLAKKAVALTDTLIQQLKSEKNEQ